MYRLFKLLTFKKLQLLITGFKLGLFIATRRRQILFYLKIIRNLQFEDLSKFFRMIKTSIYKQLKK
ncbi:MAG: hypothetical protein CBD50_04455 [bacterium TMED190]|nr:MAG: hypothetical protein CBD50_04455 [bacterium TMED190]